MTKPWLDLYPAGVPAEIVPPVARSVPELLTESLVRYATKTAFATVHGDYSFADIARLSDAFARSLCELGLPAGSRLALMTPNSVAFPIVLLGTLKAGFVLVSVNPRYTSFEVGHLLLDADVAIAVVAEPALLVMTSAAQSAPLKHIIVIPDNPLGTASAPSDGATVFAEWLSAGAMSDATLPQIASSDIALLQYTGGTTGRPKGAILSHFNIVSNILMYDAYTGPITDYGAELVVTGLPFYHIFALNISGLARMYQGSCNLIIENPADMAGYVRQLQGQRWTSMCGVNTLYNGLLNAPGFADLDFSALKLCIGGGTVTQQAVWKAWKRVTGVSILDGLGLSETSPIVSLAPLNTREFRAGIGVPLPSCDMRIRNDDGVELPPGKVGEICIGGPHVMQGYWKAPEATDTAFCPDGYLRTGDIGMMAPDGFFHLIDRKKDVINVSGFKVYPNEVEDAVAAHPAILECACVGYSDGGSGERVKLFVVPKAGIKLQVDEIARHCRERLTDYKRPKLIRILTAMPKTPVGKILRAELRKMD